MLGPPHVVSGHVGLTSPDGVPSGSRTTICELVARAVFTSDSPPRVVENDEICSHP